MQGDKIGESSGKVTSQRVLPNPGGGPKMETSFQATGKLLGVEETETGTYGSVVRPDGTLYGEGQGVIMGKEGDLATWIGQGVGTIGKAGRELSGRRVLPEFVPEMVAAEQRCRDLRIRG